MPDPADRDPALIAALPSLTALLRHRAATRPDDRAYVALSDRGGEGSAITFAELDRSYLHHPAMPTTQPHVFSAFPLLKIDDYRY